MEKNPTSAQNQNNLSKFFSDKSFIEPNIRKAKFILTEKRIYTLEFDQSITMLKLKMMIQKAAHLRKNSFSLISEGENYTKYNEETFDSLFPNKTIVIFTLELSREAIIEDETEFLLQINNPCPNHNCKFLLYYCFDCKSSICSECLASGGHKDHHIQDKCFYLLSSKYLIEKMFEDWSKMPYEDYKINVDFGEYKKLLNDKIFKELFQMLADIQNKCNNLIDKYNTISEKSLNNLRNSVREIKVSCIKALDDYKNAINVKDIINNEEIFIDFDNIYKEMGIQQKEKFKENLKKFQYLNQDIAKSIQNLIKNISENIKNFLVTTLKNNEDNIIGDKIFLFSVKPIDKKELMDQFNEKKNKIKNKKYQRKTISVLNNINQISSNNQRKDNEIINNRLMVEDDNDYIKNQNNITMNNINVNDNNTMNSNSNSNSITFSSGSITNINNINNNINNSNNNTEEIKSNGRSNNQIHIFNNLNRNTFYNNINNNNIFELLNHPEENKIINTDINRPNQLQTNSHKDLHSNIFENITTKDININKKSHNLNISKNIDSTNNNKNTIDINQKITEKHTPNVFATILENKSKNNANSNNILNPFSNQKINKSYNMNSLSHISPIQDKKTNIQNNSNISYNTSFKNEINNLNNAVLLSKEKNEISNPFTIDNINSNSNSLSSNEGKLADSLNNYNYNKANNMSNKTYVINPFSNIHNNNNFNKEIAHNNNSIHVNKKIINKNIPIKINDNAIPLGTLESNHNIITNNKQINTENNNTIKTTINKTIIYKNEIINKNSNNTLSNRIDSNTNNNFTDILAQKIIETKAQLENKDISLEQTNESKKQLNPDIISTENFVNIQYYLKKNFILCPILGTDKLKIITEDEKDEGFISISFPKRIGISTFLSNSSYCNYNKKLYISGGYLEKNNKDTNALSNKLYVIDLFQSSLEGNYSFISELPPMTFSRINHSMIGHEDKIYCIGGENNDTVERYDIKSNTWETLSPMLRKRSYPNIHIYDGYLYAFFGKENEEFLTNIERIDILKEESAQWEMILFNNPNNVDVRIYGCGLHQVDDLIYFFGGKYLGKNTDEIFFINMKERLIDKADAKLMWKQSFKENKLYQFGNKFIQISDDDYMGVYLQITLQ